MVGQTRRLQESLQLALMVKSFKGMVLGMMGIRGQESQQVT